MKLFSKIKTLLHVRCRAPATPPPPDLPISRLVADVVKSLEDAPSTWTVRDPDAAQERPVLFALFERSKNQILLTQTSHNAPPTLKDEETNVELICNRTEEKKLLEAITDLRWKELIEYSREGNEKRRLEGKLSDERKAKPL